MNWDLILKKICLIRSSEFGSKAAQIHIVRDTSFLFDRSASGAVCPLRLCLLSRRRNGRRIIGQCATLGANRSQHTAFVQILPALFVLRTVSRSAESISQNTSLHQLQIRETKAFRSQQRQWPRQRQRQTPPALIRVSSVDARGRKLARVKLEQQFHQSKPHIGDGRPHRAAG